MPDQSKFEKFLESLVYAEGELRIANRDEYRLWRAGMLLATTVLVVALVWFLRNDVPGWIDKVTAG